MESGRAASLFPETLSNFNFCSNPIESGSDSKRFAERLSSSRFCNPAIESGIAYCVTEINISTYVELQERSYQLGKSVVHLI